MGLTLRGRDKKKYGPIVVPSATTTNAAHGSDACVESVSTSTLPASIDPPSSSMSRVEWIAATQAAPTNIDAAWRNDDDDDDGSSSYHPENDRVVVSDDNDGTALPDDDEDDDGGRGGAAAAAASSLPSSSSTIMEDWSPKERVSASSLRMETSAIGDGTAAGKGKTGRSSSTAPGGNVATLPRQQRREQQRGASRKTIRGVRRAGGDGSNGGAMRKFKGIGFLTPPKKDTERVFVSSTGQKQQRQEQQRQQKQRQQQRAVGSDYSPPSVMGLIDDPDILGNENGWGGVSGFEIMLSSVTNANDDPSGAGGDSRGGEQRQRRRRHSDEKFVSAGIEKIGEHATPGGGNDVATESPSTVAETDVRATPEPSPRKNLIGLFDRSDGGNDNDNDDDYDDEEEDVAKATSVDDDDSAAVVRANANISGGGDGLVRGGNDGGAVTDVRIDSSVAEFAGEKKSRSTLSRLTRRSARASSKKIPSSSSPPSPTMAADRQRPRQFRPTVTTTPPSSSSSPAAAAHQQPHQNRPTVPVTPNEDSDSFIRVPQFIIRCDDEVSNSSTLTEPDVTRRARAIRTRLTSSNIMCGTIAEGFSTTGASSAMGASGASVTEAVDQFCGSFQSNLDNAYAAFENVLQYLPCAGSIKDAAELELETDEMFSVAFQTEIVRDGVRLIYHQSPINDATNWDQSTVKLFLRPGSCQGSQLRHPTLAWAILPVVSRMKASGNFDISFEVEKTWSTLSLLNVHSIIADEGGDAISSSFFSITAANGVVHLFEAPSAEARDYVVKGLRSVISRYTYHMIVGDSKIICDLFSDDVADTTGELPSLAKPCNLLNKVVHNLLDQQ